jgi:hypothetical protein
VEVEERQADLAGFQEVEMVVRGQHVEVVAEEDLHVCL